MAPINAANFFAMLTIALLGFIVNNIWWMRIIRIDIPELNSTIWSFERWRVRGETNMEKRKEKKKDII